MFGGFPIYRTLWGQGSKAQQLIPVYVPCSINPWLSYLLQRLSLSMSLIAQVPVRRPWDPLITGDFIDFSLFLFLVFFVDFRYDTGGSFSLSSSMNFFVDFFITL